MSRTSAPALHEMLANRTWREAATQGRMTRVLRTAALRGLDPIDFLVRPSRAADPPAVSLFG